MLEPAAVSILVGTPCTQQGVTSQYLHSMLALQTRSRELGWGLHVETRPDGLVTRTRNIFGSQMVRSDEYTHLLMIDADMGFEPAVVERLIGSGHDLVGACVPLREVRWPRVRTALDTASDLTSDEMESIAHEFAIAFPPTDDGSPSRPVDGFLVAHFVGTAMLLASREAFVRLSESDQVEYYKVGGPWKDWPGDGWTFFDPAIDPTHGNYLSEDYAFCQRWRNIGGTLWADLRSRVTHNGPVSVQGDIAESLRTAKRIAKAPAASAEGPGDSPPR
jgi:hypothetical protein